MIEEINLDEVISLNDFDEELIDIREDSHKRTKNETPDYLNYLSVRLTLLHIYNQACNFERKIVFRKKTEQRETYERFLTRSDKVMSVSDEAKISKLELVRDNITSGIYADLNNVFDALFSIDEVTLMMDAIKDGVYTEDGRLLDSVQILQEIEEIYMDSKIGESIKELILAEINRKITSTRPPDRTFEETSNLKDSQEETFFSKIAFDYTEPRYSSILERFLYYKDQSSLGFVTINDRDLTKIYSLISADIVDSKIGRKIVYEATLKKGDVDTSTGLTYIEQPWDSKDRLGIMLSKNKEINKIFYEMIATILKREIPEYLKPYFYSELSRVCDDRNYIERIKNGDLASPSKNYLGEMYLILPVIFLLKYDEVAVLTAEHSYNQILDKGYEAAAALNYRFSNTSEGGWETTWLADDIQLPEFYSKKTDSERVVKPPRTKGKELRDSIDSSISIGGSLSLSSRPNDYAPRTDLEKASKTVIDYIISESRSDDDSEINYIRSLTQGLLEKIMADDRKDLFDSLELDTDYITIDQLRSIEINNALSEENKGILFREIILDGIGYISHLINSTIESEEFKDAYTDDESFITLSRLRKMASIRGSLFDLFAFNQLLNIIIPELDTLGLGIELEDPYNKKRKERFLIDRLNWFLNNKELLSLIDYTVLRVNTDPGFKDNFRSMDKPRRLELYHDTVDTINKLKGFLGEGMNRTTLAREVGGLNEDSKSDSSKVKLVSEKEYTEPKLVFYKNVIENILSNTIDRRLDIDIDVERIASLVEENTVDLDFCGVHGNNPAIYTIDDKDLEKLNQMAVKIPSYISRYVNNIYKFQGKTYPINLILTKDIGEIIPEEEYRSIDGIKLDYESYLKLANDEKLNKLVLTVMFNPVLAKNLLMAFYHTEEIDSVEDILYLEPIKDLDYSKVAEVDIDEIVKLAGGGISFGLLPILKYINSEVTPIEVLTGLPEYIVKRDLYLLNDIFSETLIKTMDKMLEKDIPIERVTGKLYNYKLSEKKDTNNVPEVYINLVDDLLDVISQDKATKEIIKENFQRNDNNRERIVTNKEDFGSEFEEAYETETLLVYLENRSAIFQSGLIEEVRNKLGRFVKSKSESNDPFKVLYNKNSNKYSAIYKMYLKTGNQAIMDRLLKDKIDEYCGYDMVEPELLFSEKLAGNELAGEYSNTTMLNRSKEWMNIKNPDGTLVFDVEYFTSDSYQVTDMILDYEKYIDKDIIEKIPQSLVMYMETIPYPIQNYKKNYKGTKFHLNLVDVIPSEE